MILITGLGNPGKEFLKTRHNVGFDIVDSIHSEFNFPEFFILSDENSRSKSS